MTNFTHNYFVYVIFNSLHFFNGLLTAHRSVSLDNDQLDAYLLYFTISPLQSSTCFEHSMLNIRRLNCIDAASGIVLSVSGRPVHLCTGRSLTERTIPDAASIQFSLLMLSMECSKHVEDCSGRIVK